MRNKNIVISYPNPDTDGIACSIAMATFLSKPNDEWVPVILGSIGDETLFLLNQLEIEAPESLLSFDGIEKITLVDTHHKAQLPDDFPFDKVVRIIDHHPNGDDELFPSAEIINEKIGAAASIVASQYLENRLTDKKNLIFLACAILSNTLSFSAPSTSDFDRDIYQKIDALFPVSSELIDGMFENRSLILKKDIYEALNADFKVFDTKAGIVGISQIEAYNLANLLDTEKASVALERIAQEKSLDYCLFNGVDIKQNRSIVMAANLKSAELLCKIFRLDSYSGPQTFDRILLRKTDFVPPLNEDF